MRKHRPRQSPILPLGIKNKIKTELPALVALSAIGEPWFDTQHRNDLLAVALVVREMADPDSLAGRCAVALQRLCEQPIELAQKTVIALNLAECLPWLQLQPNHRVQRAIEAIAARELAMAA